MAQVRNVAIDETDTRFYVDQSTIPGAGRGLFARASLRAGDRLTVIGVRLRRDSLSDRCTGFADEYKVRAGDFVLIPCGLAAMANHSSAPNMVKVVEGDDVFLRLLVDVAAGSELCFAYSDYALERWGIPGTLPKDSATGSPSISGRRLDIVLTDPSSSFECDYTSGVNRVMSLGSYLLVDNIARNFEVWQFGRAAGETPERRSLYDVSAYPNDPMASLLDVDVHAALLCRGGQELLVVNHYGCVRWFDMPPSNRHLSPVREMQLVGDTERVVFAHDCFIASSPRGEHTDDPARPGVLFFEPVASHGPGRAATRLAYEAVLADWDVISAINVSAEGALLAVASGPRVGVFALGSGTAGLRLGACQWEADVPFHCQWLHFDTIDRLWTGGYQILPSDPGGDNWDACRAGGAIAFDPNGVRVLESDLPDETAWGYGADPLVLSPDARRLFVLGRDGSLHATVPSEQAAPVCLYRAIQAQADIEAPSLGIGHAAFREGWLYAGFSRGGYRLLRYDLRGT